MTTSEHVAAIDLDEVRPLAKGALLAALADDTDQAHEYIKRIDREHGGAGLYFALIAWVDTYVEHATDGARDVLFDTVGFVDPDSGKLSEADDDDLPDVVAWVGRVVCARSRMDEAAFDDLVLSPTSDGRETAARVSTLLHCVAATMNGLPRGFVAMGEGADS